MQKNCVEKHSSLHTLFLEYETQNGQKKKTGQWFSIELQFTCRTSDKSEKNRKTA